MLKRFSLYNYVRQRVDDNQIFNTSVSLFGDVTVVVVKRSMFLDSSNRWLDKTW